MPQGQAYLFPCASCGNNVVATQALMGKVGRCPLCLAEFRVGAIAGGPLIPVAIGKTASYPEVQPADAKRTPPPTASGRAKPQKPEKPPSDRSKAIPRSGRTPAEAPPRHPPAPSPKPAEPAKPSGRPAHPEAALPGFRDDARAPEPAAKAPRTSGRAPEARGAATEQGGGRKADGGAGAPVAFRDDARRSATSSGPRADEFFDARMLAPEPAASGSRPRRAPEPASGEALPEGFRDAADPGKRASSAKRPAAPSSGSPKVAEGAADSANALLDDLPDPLAEDITIPADLARENEHPSGLSRDSVEEELPFELEEAPARPAEAAPRAKAAPPAAREVAPAPHPPAPPAAAAPAAAAATPGDAGASLQDSGSVKRPGELGPGEIPMPEPKLLPERAAVSPKSPRSGKEAKGSERRRMPRFSVKDGLVRLPWGPFRARETRLVLDDLSVGGMKCHAMEVSIPKAGLEQLTGYLRSGEGLRCLVDVPAFQGEMIFRARLKRVEVNTKARRVTMSLQFMSAAPESLKRLQRLAESPIIRTLIRNLTK